MKAEAWLLLPCSAVVLDVALLAIGLAAVPREPRPIFLAVLAHAAAAIAFGVFLRKALLEMKRDAHAWVVALGASVALFVPAIGAAALVSAIYVLAVAKPKEEAVAFGRYAPPSAFERRPPTELRPRVLTDRLVHLVSRGRTIETRFKAVLQTNDAPAVVAVPVLKAALADTAEEVRLSAFSQLERTRRAIDARIERARERLKQELTPIEARSIHTSLAEDYYEIAYLGLAEGEVYKHALKSALTHAREALAIEASDAAMLRLVGRILLRQAATNEPAEGAREAFEAALAAGMPVAELATDRAEEAFRRRALTEVAEALSTMDDVAHDHVLLAKIQEFWRWR